MERRGNVHSGGLVLCAVHMFFSSALVAMCANLSPSVATEEGITEMPGDFPQH